MATKKSAKKRTARASKRELLAAKGDKRYIRRDSKGRIKESDDQGRSLSQDRRRSAKTAAKRGHGDRGDRRGSSATKAAPDSRRNAAPDSEAIAQLTADHARVKKMFREYEKLAQREAGDAEREDLAAMICAELTAHATAEEEIFYPAVRSAIAESDLIDEAEVEHGSAKDLIAQIEASSPSNDRYDALVKVLGEYINHHVQEEEGEIFPKVRKAKVDTRALGEKIAARKEAIMKEIVTTN